MFDRHRIRNPFVLALMLAGGLASSTVLANAATPQQGRYQHVQKAQVTHRKVPSGNNHDWVSGKKGHGQGDTSQWKTAKPQVYTKAAGRNGTVRANGHVVHAGSRDAGHQ